MKALSVLQTLKQAIELSHFNNSGVTFGKDTITEINEAIAELKEPVKLLTCEWVVDDPEWNSYKTGCGKYFNIIEGSIGEHEFKHCTFCGGVIEEQKDSQ